jgi:uncharacterized protein (UPF0147 family)
MTSTCDAVRVGPDQIVARLKAIRDARMRTLVLVEAFRDGDPALWVQVLAAIVHRAHVVDDADAIEALESVTHAAADPALPYDTRQALYEAATDQGLVLIARLFLVTTPPTPDLAPERPLKPTGRPLTLGERKALARTHRREQLLLLIRDPHPAVVAILLDNPHVTESDVVRIAAARPGVPASLALVASHARWSVRHPVKRALVLNPATPLADAIRIATTLRRAELEEIAADPALPEPLRKHAADVCAHTARRPRA